MYTMEERKAWHGRMAELARKVRAMEPDERARLAETAGTRTCEGHVLGTFNTIYLMMQNGGTVPAMVGGVRQWRKVGRAVMKGEHALGYIYVPMGSRPSDGPESDAAEVETTSNVRFRLVPVFDIEQTIEVQ